MKLLIEDRFLIMSFDSPEEERLVKDAFTFDDMSATFLGGKFDKRKIKKKCLVRNLGQYMVLPSGFLLDLMRLIKTDPHISLKELTDKRTKFSHQSKDVPSQELKNLFPAKFKYINHQINSLRAMLKTSWGIIEAPTSSGKSETIIAYIKATRLPTLIVVNRINLAMQLKDRLCENGIPAGIACTNQFISAPVMVATIGSVGKVTLTNFQVLIVDECHRAQARTFQNFLKVFLPPIRFGFSATPDGGDKYKFALIKQYLGEVIYKVNIKELLENEVIANPKISFIRNTAQPAVSWATSYLSGIVFNYQRNNKIREMVEKHNLQTMILVRIIDHGKELANSIPNSIFVSGIDDPVYRKQVIEDFEKGDLKVIISSNIFNEGISINAIKLLIIASGGKSKIETIQKLGRGLRIRPDKNEVLVYDFDDIGNMFTERHSQMRKNIYEKAGFEILEQ